MELRVNGESMSTRAKTLEALLQELNIRPEGVAAEVNLSVVSKRDYATWRLKPGDAVEIVKFVAGG